MQNVTRAGPVGRSSADDLYRRYVHDVFSLAYRAVGSRPEAEDVTQTTFLNAHRALLDGVEPTDHRAWLLTIARNVCRSRFRTLHRRPREEPLDESLYASNAEEGTASHIMEAVRALPPRQRTALVMRAVDGRSSAEIGAKLGLKAQAVDALLHRAREALRHELQTEAPVDCALTEDLVQLQLLHELASHEQARLRSHLRACATCAKTARRLRARRRLGSILALPWDLANRLASLIGQSSPTVRIASLMGALTLGATVAVEHHAVRPNATGSPVEHAADPTLPTTDLLAAVHHDTTPKPRTPRAKTTLSHPPSQPHSQQPAAASKPTPSPPTPEATAPPSHDTPPSHDMPPTLGNPEAGANPPTPAPPPKPAPAAPNPSPTVPANGGAISVAADSDGASADIGIKTDVLDASASASVSTSSGVTASTDISTTTGTPIDVRASASASASDGVSASASVGVSLSGNETITISVKVPTLLPPLLPQPGH